MAQRSLVGADIHGEVDAIARKRANMIIVGTEKALLPEEVTVEAPKCSDGEDGDVASVESILAGRKDEQGSNENHCPAFHPEGIRSQAVDDALDEFEVFELAFH